MQRRFPPSFKGEDYPLLGLAYVMGLNATILEGIWRKIYGKS
jgi:hypothetical protein